MKILLLHTKYQFQGGEDSVVEQELELLKQYHTVEILYFQNHGGWRGALQFFASVWNFFSVKKIKQKIEEFEPDIVHVHNWHFATGPLIFRKIHSMGVPIVHTIHNYRLLCPSAILLHKGKLFENSLHKSFPWKAIRNKVYRSSLLLTFWLALIVWFHKKIGTWKTIDTYVCLTSFAVNLFQQSNFGVSGEKFAIKPNFISTSTQVVNKKENQFVFIGRLSEEKGISVLLDAFKELPFILKIAGDGPLKELILKASREFPNIIYIGNLSKDEVVKSLQETQALISPSICYEGMPMTILEAFSCGTPVIASNLGAMTSMISDGANGFLFESGNVFALKDVILKFERLSINEKNQISINAFNDYKTIYSAELQKKYFDEIYYSLKKKNI